jgi:hypothetical protein
MNLYIYKKLDPQRREIRLCTLQPGSGDDPVNCTLTTVSLDDKPRYEAVSYVWGDASMRQEIVVDSKSLLVTVNLHTALRYLRWKDRPRVLWADAICINQQNIDERSSQVSFMDNIYREAVEVQVWLCEEEEVIPEKPLDTSDLMIRPFDARRFNEYLKREGFSRPQPPLISMSHDSMKPTVVDALEILRLFTDRRHFHEMPFFYTTPSLEVELSPKWHEILHMISLILSRPWWKRVWVVQEVVVAADSTVHIGVHQAPLSLFIEAVESYRGHIDCCQTSIIFSNWWYGNATVAEVLHSSFLSVYSLAAIKRYYNEGSLHSGLAFQVSSSREASDPRDRVYAFIGLFRGQRNVLDIVPDYGVSVSELYANVTRMMIRDRRSLMPLELVVSVQDNLFGLPSWAIDLISLSSSKTLLRPGFNASGSKVHKPLGEHGLFLTIQGFEVDFVSKFATLEVDVYSEKNLVRTIKQWQDFALHAQVRDERTLWRTVFRDNIDLLPSDRTISSKEYDLIEQWWQRINEVVDDPTSATKEGGLFEELNIKLVHINITARGILRENVPYVTGKGSLGSAPSAVREGDKIFIAEGSDVPLILRPVEELPGWNPTSANTSRPYYRLVGLCYLDGVMEGEAVHADVVWEQIRLL